MPFGSAGGGVSYIYQGNAPDFPPCLLKYLERGFQYPPKILEVKTPYGEGLEQSSFAVDNPLIDVFSTALRIMPKTAHDTWWEFVREVGTSYPFYWQSPADSSARLYRLNKLPTSKIHSRSNEIYYWDSEFEAIEYKGNAPTFSLNTPKVSIAGIADAAEPNSPGTFRLSRTGFVGKPLSVNIVFTGTAIKGTDYQNPGNPLVATFAAGQYSKDITIDPIDDTFVEAPETIVATIILSSNYTIEIGTATINVLSDDVLTVSASVINNASEPNISGLFRLTRAGSTSGSTTVNLSYGGTATSGVDYQSLPATATFANGVTTVDISVTVIDDSASEDPETIVLTIVSGSGYSIGVATATMLLSSADDLPVVSIAKLNDAAEPNTNGAFRITRLGAISDPLTINFTVAGTASNGVDYQPVGTSIVIPANNGHVDLPIIPIDDNSYEVNETIIITISNDANYLIGTNSASLNLTSEDFGEVTIVGTNNATEGGANGTFTLTRTGNLTSSLSVNFTKSGTGVEGTHYQTIGTVVTFLANSATATISIVAIDDAVFAGAKTVTLTIAGGSGYSIGTPSSGTISIVDDDTPPQVSIAAIDNAYRPSNPGAFRLTRSGVTTVPLNINITTAGSAVAGTDYQSISSAQTIAAGSSFVDIIVNPL
jgi:hypothetical protein